MDLEKKNVFVVGLDAFNRAMLEAVPGAETCAFHQLLSPEEIHTARRFDLEALLDKAREVLRGFAGRVDAIIGYWDFPTGLMMPILRREIGLEGPSLESVLRCEHKYWSRVEQSHAVPDVVPPFALVDPFSVTDETDVGLPFPFWIKPVKTHSSFLGFRIGSRSELRTALAKIRRGIDRWAEPLDVIMGYAELPAAIRPVTGRHCIAEAIISRGRQCTLEGYVYAGDVSIYGAVDSVRGPNRSSFERYEYPSALPEKVMQRMGEATRLVIGQFGLDRSPFNIEFFHDASNDRIWLLEVNARISKSHSPLFQMVDGAPHNAVMLDVALGRQPAPPRHAGAFTYAAKFMPRLYGSHDDAVVRSAPSAKRLRDIECAHPGTSILLHVQEGMKLGAMHHQDAYSYELAAVFVGAQSRRELRRTFNAVWKDMAVDIGGL